MASAKQPALPRYLSEAAAAFLLTFAVIVSVSTDYPVATPLLAALTLGVLAYLVGPISGTHANPAVTLGLLVIRKISPLLALGYVLAQAIGAMLAWALAMRLLDPAVPQPGPMYPGIVGEVLGTFVLAFGVTRVVNGRVDAAASGIVVGLSLFLGITVASAGSLGIINPAVAAGLGIFTPSFVPGLETNLIVYLVAPIVGGVLGALAANNLAKNR